MFTLPVFFYPTSIVSIDDDKLFLHALSNHLNNVVPFSCPKECLSFFEAYIPPLTNTPFLHGCIDHDHYDTMNHAPVDFNASALRQLHRDGNFIVIDENEQPAYFIVHTEYTLNSLIQLNDDVSDVYSYISSIQKREKIPFFGAGNECSQFEVPVWPHYLHLPELIEGREKYYWAAIPCDKLNINHLPNNY
jgi:hypothetical protein